MAAYEDFIYFRNTERGALRAGHSPDPLRPWSASNALHAELTRLHRQVRRLRARARQTSWHRRIGRDFRRWLQRIAAL